MAKFWRRKYEVEAIRAVPGLVVNGTEAAAGDWLVFSDGRVALFADEAFREEFIASKREAKALLGSDERQTGFAV